jgi:hypothetical protein
LPDENSETTVFQFQFNAPDEAIQDPTTSDQVGENSGGNHLPPPSPLTPQVQPSTSASGSAANNLQIITIYISKQQNYCSRINSKKRKNYSPISSHPNVLDSRGFYCVPRGNVIHTHQTMVVSRHPLVQLDYLAFECAGRSEPDGSKNKNSRKKIPIVGHVTVIKSVTGRNKQGWDMSGFLF